MRPDTLLLGIDGGATKCQARLCAPSGARIAESIAGPANIRFGLEASFSAILQAAGDCLAQAGLSVRDLPRIVACLALAGASEPSDLAAARRRKHPFRHAVILTDAQAACLGAHGGRDGGVVVVGTGTIAWAELKGRQYRLGGWGLTVSDEGSAAWLGRELLRRVLWAYDERIVQTPLLRATFAKYGCDPHAVADWASRASPRDFGTLAPLVTEHAGQGDPVAHELMSLAASHIDVLAGRLVRLGVRRLALVGGLAEHIRPWVSPHTASHLTTPKGDALDGALQVARATAESVAA